jgi:pyruvate/2-oxoglutarate/acetoin dehydrogenase E1 component
MSKCQRFCCIELTVANLFLTVPFTLAEQGKDFVLPIGKAKVERAGSDVTITAFSKMVGYSLQVLAIWGYLE